MSFQKLDALGRKLEALEHALSILGADEATHMAVGGGDKRAEAMANLAGMYHAQATAPEIAATAPTDRSIPRVAMTSVMPRAMSRTGAVLRRTFA